MKKRFLLIVFALIPFFANTGCLPVVAGGAAAGGYYVGNDERGVKGIFSDASITANVKARLLEDKAVSGLKIDVDTNAGNVVLTGRVSTKEEKAKAVAIASGVKGVKEVKDGLAVIP